MRDNRPQSSAITFPDDNVTRSGRIGFILGVWLPLEFKTQFLYTWGVIITFPINLGVFSLISRVIYRNLGKVRC